MNQNDQLVAQAFDKQAEKFERAPLQTNREALLRLVTFAALPAGSRVLDAGCGPGLVAEAFLEAGHRVHGVDLSGEMVRRARERCARFGDRARFEQGSVLGPVADAPFDAAISRLVLHHVPDAWRFFEAQVRLVRPGGVVVLCDHTTDPDPAAGRWHNEIERARDRTHALSLTPGALVDLFARAGLEQLQMSEDSHGLDFDEWFDRGSSTMPKAEVRAKLLAGRARGFTPAVRPDGGITIQGSWSFVRGVKPL